MIPSVEPRTLGINVNRSCLLCAAWVIALSVHAHADVGVERRDEARAHFQSGLALANASRFEEAAIEFESAYALSPQPAVLFNIAMAYTNARRLARAASYLRRYLNSADADQRRLQDARKRLTELMEVVGKVEVLTDPQQARLFLDGEEVTTPIIADPGAHVLEASADGFVAASRALRISQGDRQTVRVELERSAQLQPQPPVSAPALLLVRCNLPDVRIHVDGTSIASTPQPDPLRVGVGTRRILLERPGFRSQDLSVEARESALAVVDCELHPEQSLPPAFSSQLRVRPTVVDAQVFLDERPFPGNGSVPSGRHSLRVERPGYVTWSTMLQLQPQRSVDVTPVLVPTELTRRTREQEIKQRTWLTGTTAAAGLVLVGVTSWLVIDNQSRYATWQSEQRALDEQWRKSTAENPPITKQQANDDRGDRIKLQDEIAVGTGVAAGALLIGAAALFVTRPSELPVRASVGPGRSTASLSLIWQ